MAKKDYYEILGVDRDASEAGIKKAYRILARQHHPDVNQHDPQAESKFKEISEAYEVLSDSEKRRRYDMSGHYKMGGFGDFDFSDLDGFDPFDATFSDFFNMFFGEPFTTRGRRPTVQRGSDLSYELEITFEEAVFGTEKNLKIPRFKPCKTCGGSGTGEGTLPNPCPNCQGTGRIQTARHTRFGSFVTTTTCNVCQGSGDVISSPCLKCQGQGRISGTETVTIKIPAGASENAGLRLAGQGEAGIRGGPPGDLYITMNVKPHPIFKRVGNDLFCELSITFVQAALGAEIEVLTLQGLQRLKIPPGTQNGTIFELKGQGVPYLEGRGRGNLHIQTTIIIPTKLTTRQHELLRQFAEASGQDLDESVNGFLKRFKDVFK